MFATKAPAIRVDGYLWGKALVSMAQCGKLHQRYRMGTPHFGFLKQKEPYYTRFITRRQAGFQQPSREIALAIGEIHLI